MINRYLIPLIAAVLAGGPALACVDINAAAARELQRISHIDATRSAEIEQLREARRFDSVGALVRVRGIGAARLRDILDQGLACVDGVSAAGPRETISGQARVLDADTLAVAGHRVRLIGIDAPEGGQTCAIGGRPWACGEAATAAVRAMVGGAPVSCAVYGWDRYGRALAECRRDGISLNAAIVRAGWALAWYPGRGAIPGPRYDAEQGEAARARAGIWRGEFVAPWVWRRR